MLNKAVTLAEMLKAFETGKKDVLKEVYILYRNDFISFGRTLHNDQNDLIDAFQESVIALYENLVAGKISESQTLLKTYLFAIGKNKLLDYADKRRRQSIMSQEYANSAERYRETNRNSDHYPMNKAMEQLGEKCRELLLLFYFHRYSINAIMFEMNYKNENTVKANKSRCLAQLREFMVKENK